jgi:hypothetical protein
MAPRQILKFIGEVGLHATHPNRILGELKGIHEYAAKLQLFLVFGMHNIFDSIILVSALRSIRNKTA